MRYRLMATYYGIPYHAGLGPDGNEATLFSPGPPPDELVFITSFEGGEVFRSGCCWYRGNGRVAYFSPGDQDYPVYHHPDIQRVLANAVRWAAPRRRHPVPDAPESPRGWFER